jgi:MtN3 and saliva related transmembrane protein
MELTTIVGVAASILTGASLLPQLIKVIKEKKSSGISFIMLFVLLTGVSLWIWYGALRSDLIIVISNSVSAALNILIFIMSFYYERKTTPAPSR